MKIVHYATVVPKTISGLIRRVMEIHKLEKALGWESGLVSPQDKHENGYTVEGTPALEILPWSWAADADVHVMDGSVPGDILALKNRVFMAHGGPKYCALTELNMKRSSFTLAINMVQNCELTITQNRQHQRFWREFGGDVRWVQGGVDLEKWIPEGTKIPFPSHPCIVYMDIWRDMKLPMTLFMAMKEVVKEVPTARLQLFNVPKGREAWWMRVLCKVGVDHLVENYKGGIWGNPEQVYRGADIIVNPVEGGTISGVGVEALACGCPVLILEGNKSKYASIKSKDDPDSMAKALVKLWKRIEADRDEVRLEARMIAEKNYSVRRMVTEMLDIYVEKFGLKAPEGESKSST